MSGTNSSVVPDHRVVGHADDGGREEVAAAEVAVGEPCPAAQHLAGEPGVGDDLARSARSRRRRRRATGSCPRSSGPTGGMASARGHETAQNSSTSDSSTNTREAAEHFWPANPNADRAVPSTAEVEVG